MKKIIIKSVILSLGIITILGCSKDDSEEIINETRFDKSKYIELKFHKLAIKLQYLYVSGKTKTTPIWFDINGDGKLDKENELNKYSIDLNKLQNNTLRIYGEVKRLDCPYNDNDGGGANRNLISLNISKQPKLEVLVCSESLLKELDVSKNTNLKHLDIIGTAISNIDLSKNVNLISFRSIFNKSIKKLDFSHNIKLKKIDLEGSNISKIDLSKNVNLEELNCKRCMDLTQLNTQNNVNLEKIDISFTKIPSIDLSKNINLKDLYFVANRNVKEFNITQNVNLESFTFRENNIEHIDISNNPKLKVSKIIDDDFKYYEKSIKCIKVSQKQMTDYKEYMDYIGEEVDKRVKLDCN